MDSPNGFAFYANVLGVIRATRKPPRKPTHRRALTFRQQVFLKSYLTGPPGVRGNGNRSLRAAGYSLGNGHGGKETARILHHPAIEAVIEKYMDRVDLTIERTLREVMAVAFSRITDVIEWDGQEVRRRPSEELPALVTTAIAGIDQTPGPGGPSVQVRMHDKVRALGLLAKILRIGKPHPAESVEALLAQVDLGRLSGQERATLHELLVKVTRPGPPPTS